MFVVLEGGEGAGKSTLAKGLRKRLEDAGRGVTVTREPGGTDAGEHVRDILHGRLAPWAEVFAFLTARAQLVAEVIRPALQDGEIVICDRYTPSTMAYQGYGRGLDLDELRRLNALATGALEPDLVVLLDLEPRVGLARKRGELEAIRTGEEGLVFHERVRAGYHALAAADAGRWVVIDASRSPDEVLEDSWAAMRRLARES
jgi:dTMP kinase